jgi:ABC-type glycerol-3-phosphate transport system substrate-binding protein
MPFMDTTKKFYYNADFTDVVFDHPEWIEGAKFVKDLIFKHKVTNTSLPIPDQAVAQGLAAMTFRESFYANFLKQNAPNMEFGIAPFPVGASPLGGYPTGAIPWLGIMSVSVDSKNPDVAWDFTMFMANEKNEIRMTKNNGGFSRLKAHQADPFFKTLPYYDTYKVMTEQRPLVQNPYLDPNALQAELEAKLGEVVVQILTDANADPEKLLKDLAVYGRKRLQEVKK